MFSRFPFSLWSFFVLPFFSASVLLCCSASWLPCLLFCLSVFSCLLFIAVQSFRFSHLCVSLLCCFPLFFFMFFCIIFAPRRGTATIAATTTRKFGPRNATEQHEQVLEMKKDKWGTGVQTTWIIDQKKRMGSGTRFFLNVHILNFQEHCQTSGNKPNNKSSNKASRNKTSQGTMTRQRDATTTSSKSLGAHCSPFFRRGNLGGLSW